MSKFTARAKDCNIRGWLQRLGYLTLDKTAFGHLFQLVNKAYERVSLIATSNLDFTEWGTLVPVLQQPCSTTLM